MKSPVFFNQNQTGLSLSRSQPNCQSKKVAASTALLCVDHHIWGRATTEAARKNSIQSRQRRWTSARTPPTAMTATKL